MHSRMWSLYLLLMSGLLWYTAGPEATGADTDPQQAAAINRANELQRQGKIDEALSIYRSLPETGPYLRQRQYNQGVAELQAGNWTAAQQLLGQAAQASDDELAANAYFNLGNSQYAAALSLMEAEAASAIDELRAAIASYRAALTLRADWTDARQNIELAVRLLDSLQEDKSANEPPASEQSSADHASAAEEQAEPDGQGTSQPQPQPQPPSESPSEQSSSGSTTADAEASQADAASAQEQESSSGGSDASPPAGEDQASAADEQQPPQPAQADRDADATEPITETNPTTNAASPPDGNDQEQGDAAAAAQADADSPDESQAPPSGQLSVNGQPGTEEAAANSDEQAERGQVSRYMTREEAMKLLQAVRDRDMLRRLQQQRAEQARRLPVERDW